MPKEKLLLKKALFDELKKTNEEIERFEKGETYNHELCDSVLFHLKSHKEFVQKLIDICVNRNKF